MRYTAKQALFTLILSASLSVLTQNLSAYEFGGMKGEYMNTEQTNFYGFGLFTSNKRFDAEIEGFFAQELFSGKYQDPGYITDKYKLFFVAFTGYFHFIRTEKLSFYGGMGIMPWLPKAYAYHFVAGMDFFWTENWRLFYNFRYLVNNASDYQYPSGTSVSVGIKFAVRWINI